MPEERDFPVRELRQALGLNQQDFAHELRVSVASVSAWERGISKPSRLAREKLEALERRAKKEVA